MEMFPETPTSVVMNEAMNVDLFKVDQELLIDYLELYSAVEKDEDSNEDKTQDEKQDEIQDDTECLRR